MRESHGHIRTHAESRAEGWSLTRQTPSEGHRQGRNSAPHAERESVAETEMPEERGRRDSAGGPSGETGRRTAVGAPVLAWPQAGNQRIRWEEGTVSCVNQQ